MEVRITDEAIANAFYRLAVSPSDVGNFRSVSAIATELNCAKSPTLYKKLQDMNKRFLLIRKATALPNGLTILYYALSPEFIREVNKHA